MRTEDSSALPVPSQRPFKVFQRSTQDFDLTNELPSFRLPREVPAWTDTQSEKDPMHSALSFTLTLCLLAATLPVRAQGRTPVSFETAAVMSTRSTIGPIARAVMREAARLAAAGAPPAGQTAIQPAGAPGASNWSRVVTVARGAAVVVTVRGAKPARGTFVQADEGALFMHSGRWPVLQTIARGEVLEVRMGPSSRRRALGLLVGVGGAVGGAVVGAAVGGRGSDPEDLRGSSIGGMAGLVGGAVLGYRGITRARGTLIYRAPW